MDNNVNVLQDLFHKTVIVYVKDYTFRVNVIDVRINLIQFIQMEYVNVENHTINTMDNALKKAQIKEIRQNQHVTLQHILMINN